jgi:FAD/FMN-containing dehydrogenase/Fe-S oxidoreductase
LAASTTNVHFFTSALPNFPNECLIYTLNANESQTVMDQKIPVEALQKLAGKLSGDLHFDQLMRVLYATDASVYRELPLAVALPKNEEDIQLLINFAHQHHTSLIPRSAGTSLAGQCVGDGIVVDVSKYMTQILELNQEEGWVRVQPGVIRDELNRYVKPFGLFFGPNTSTSNRCMIGGMVGNNSCGTTSVVYGSTRDHVLELHTILSDGSKAIFKDLNAEELEEKCKDNISLESKIYLQLLEELGQASTQENIRKEFPKQAIHRRNTGYAVDELLKLQPFEEKGRPFNFCKLLTGSEGTLAFTTEIKLHLDPLPPPQEVVAAIHFPSISDSMKATLLAMKHQPSACELVDKIILDCTKGNIAQEKNRFFVQGDPAAILCVEFRADDIQQARNKALALIEDMKQAQLGYAYPIIEAPKTKSVWNLRKAGLGLLSNVPGDAKPVACIEDTAVDLPDLPDYIREFEELMEEYGQRSVFYAHAGAGELHLRPLLDLKKKKDRRLFHDITRDTASLVKKYQGSLSGEHGDGRVRAEFIPMMVGTENYELFRRLKSLWDPMNIFNPGKIVEAAPMNEFLRYEEEQENQSFDTAFSFKKEGGILRAVEKCNGSGDCRKLPAAGGTMCPSYQATRNEKDTTRGRANALREFLTRHKEEDQPFAHPELKEVMDLCIGCKGCTSECPSNVDMASIKSEFTYQYQKANGFSRRSRLFAENARYNRLAAKFRPLSNWMFTQSLISSLMKNYMGIHPKRSIPTLSKQNLHRWYRKNYPKIKPEGDIKGKVLLFADEFTQLLESHIGICSIELLCRLGYEVELLKHPESGRSHISKGFLDEAKVLAEANVRFFADLASEEQPLIGIEPSAILSFRDEYPRLVGEELVGQAEQLKQHAFLIDEFLEMEARKGNISTHDFTQEARRIHLHGHCHQKALSSASHTAWLLSLPENYTVDIIPSGCCGMAGSFGYEKEHYEVSMKIGEMVLFPAVRKAEQESLIAAPGTSCRAQILDGTGREALHPVEILHRALK